MTKPALRPTYPFGLPTLAALSAFVLIIVMSAGRASPSDAPGSAIEPGSDSGPRHALATPDLSQAMGNQTARLPDRFPGRPENR